jgi:hypothetical protein
MIGDPFLMFHALELYSLWFGIPKSMQDLKRFLLSRFDRNDHSARSVVAGFFPVSPDLCAFRCNNDAAQLADLKGSLIIGLGQASIATHDRCLVAVPPDGVPLKHGCWLAFMKVTRVSIRSALYLIVLPMVPRNGAPSSTALRGCEHR